MELKSILPWLVLGVGAWCVLMGVLHDIFILAGEHGKKYDRNLLRLLMDGHILITVGAMMLVTFTGLKTQETWAMTIAVICAISLIVYVAMIWPFLKSVGTLTFSVAVLVTTVIAWLSKSGT
jgi:hypothetical protein